MDYDKNYIETIFDATQLHEIFIKEFVQFRKENNLTQELFSKYSNVTREKIARIESGYCSPTLLSLLKILAPIGYTITITKIKKK